MAGDALGVSIMISVSPFRMEERLMRFRTQRATYVLAVALGAAVLTTAAVGAANPSGANKPGEAPAHAQAGKKEAREAERDARKEAREEAREERKSAREEAREENQDARAERVAPEDASGGVAPETAPVGGRAAEKAERIAERRKRLPLRLAELEKTRAERVRVLRDEAEKRWGKHAASPALRNEMIHHAWRMARLAAIRRIALAEGRTDAVARVDVLAAKEQARHEKFMQNAPGLGGGKAEAGKARAAQPDKPAGVGAPAAAANAHTNKPTEKQP
jgi:hypothetical protein